jgi:hypothetical protein
MTISSMQVNARFVPGEDAEHHTRDGYAPRTFASTMASRVTFRAASR